MTKKILSVLLTLLVVCSLFTGCTDGKPFEKSAEIEYKITDSEAVVTKIPDKTIQKTINIPDEINGVPVTAVKDFSGVNLEHVTEISIGKNVKEIGLWAFENNQHMKAFKVHKSNKYFKDVDGVLFSKDMKTLLFYPLEKGVKEQKNKDGSVEKSISYQIPEGVETIRTKAFYKCQNLTSVTIPDSVTRIEEKAFFRCNLKKADLPDKLKFIGKDAFSYCSAIEEILIPETIEEIGEYAFYNCNNLLNVKINKKESDITLGKKWFPTNNGLDIEGLKIQWK